MLCAIVALGCSPEEDDSSGTDADVVTDRADGFDGSDDGGADADGLDDAARDMPDVPGDDGTGCPPLATPAGPEAVLGPDFVGLYSTYDLGPVPGAPTGTLLGGCVLRYDDSETLLIAIDSERDSGAIYAVGIERDACRHITGFRGTATPVADTPYVDANLVYGPNHVLFYTQWPVNKLSQLLPGAGSPAYTLDLATIGVGGGGPGGIGFVPPPLSTEGELRIVTWPNGLWYHLTYTPSGDVFDISAPVQTTTLPNGPGGFAYVPAGSPGFVRQSIIMAEWSENSVAVYECDDQGDPLVETRRPFYTTFPRPWGAYFESETGDFMFLTWGSPPDRVYIVQGFAPPPDIFF